MNNKMKDEIIDKIIAIYMKQSIDDINCYDFLLILIEVQAKFVLLLQEIKNKELAESLIIKA
jgi:hypothetical protein